MRTGLKEIKETSTAIELGEEEGGVGLGVRRFDPVKARPNDAVMSAAFAEDPAAIAAQSHGGRREIGGERDWIEKEIGGVGL